MKAKDIALLCTAAAGAGAAAGAAVSSANAKNQKTNANKKTLNKSTVKAEKSAQKNEEKIKKADISEIFIDNSLPLVFQSLGTDNDSGIITAVFGRGKECRAYRITADNADEIRCPSAVIDAQSIDDCTFFITEKGGVFVYTDPEKEPVLCGLTSPEYVCVYNGLFYVFSDSLLYICEKTGEITKTVSLGALIDITKSDICDAENSDGSFASSAVSIKKAAPLGSTGFLAIVTSDGRSFLMHSDKDDFYSFEKTYENILDVCSFGGFAYYLCRIETDFGIIKTRLAGEKCETAAKYTLSSSDNPPVKLYGGKYGLGVLYSDGRVKFLLPEIAAEKKRENCRKKLAVLGSAFQNVKADNIFTIGGFVGYSAGVKIFVVK